MGRSSSISPHSAVAALLAGPYEDGFLAGTQARKTRWCPGWAPGERTESAQRQRLLMAGAFGVLGASLNLALVTLIVY